MAFVAPDLTAALGTATANNKWSPSDAKQAKDWFVNFLQAVANAPAGTVINVMNKKADDLWHVYLNDPNYDTYCIDNFGRVLDHIETPPRRKPTAAELAAVQPYYSPNWPIPDSIVSCVASAG
jgi:hypothetical protein